MHQNLVLVNNTLPATHFIEVTKWYNGHRWVTSCNQVRPINELPRELFRTIEYYTQTVAVFKIRYRSHYITHAAMLKTIAFMSAFPVNIHIVDKAHTYYRPDPLFKKIDE